MKTKALAALQELTDIFTGTDGGVSFLKLKTFIEEMERRSSQGDKDADKILEIMFCFERLCEVVKKQ